MNNPPRILVVDDSETNRDIITTRLETHGYETLQAADGEEALAAVKQHRPDLVLLDVMMPNLDGIETCRRLKGDAAFPFLPVILVTAKVDSKDIVAGLDAGADEYLTKPVDQAALVARVRSVLRVKALHDQVQAQAADLATWNRTLEQRVAEQVAEIARIGRLKRFLSPQIAQLVSSGDERVLESHRREVTVVFCDLRDFTAFAESAEPEEVIEVLRDYHSALGALIDKFEGTVERFAGDGIMVLFNDPLPCEAPWTRAVQMAVAMRDEVAKLAANWRTHGHDLGRRERSQILPPASAIRRATARFWSTRRYTRKSNRWLTWNQSASSNSKVSAGRSKHSTCASCTRRHMGPPRAGFAGLNWYCVDRHPYRPPSPLPSPARRHRRGAARSGSARNVPAAASGGVR